MRERDYVYMQNIIKIGISYSLCRIHFAHNTIFCKIPLAFLINSMGGLITSTDNFITKKINK